MAARLPVALGREPLLDRLALGVAGRRRRAELRGDPIRLARVEHDNRRAAWPHRSRSAAFPVASGSRLPAWPAFSRLNRRLTRCNAWFDDEPARLVEQQHARTRLPGVWSLPPSPWSRVESGVAARCRGAIVDELAELDGALRARVVAESQLGNAPQLQRLPTRVRKKPRACSKPSLMVAGSSSRPAC